LTERHLLLAVRSSDSDGVATPSFWFDLSFPLFLLSFSLLFLLCQAKLVFPFYRLVAIFW
jgi:hypothetical protein